MQETVEDVFLYYFHESLVVNFYLCEEVCYFRLAVPRWYACEVHPEIADQKGKYCVVDVICKDCKFQDVWIESAMIEFAGAEVLDFKMDQDGNAFFFIEDFYHAWIKFHCQSFEEKDVAIVDYKELEGDKKDYDTKWSELPINEIMKAVTKNEHR